MPGNGKNRFHAIPLFFIYKEGRIPSMKHSVFSTSIKILIVTLILLTVCFNREVAQYLMIGAALLWLIIMIGCIPVSYTHLDVYKRQVLMRILPWTSTRICSWSGCLENIRMSSASGKCGPPKKPCLWQRVPEPAIP